MWKPIKHVCIAIKKIYILHSELGCSEAQTAAFLEDELDYNTKIVLYQESTQINEELLSCIA